MTMQFLLVVVIAILLIFNISFTSGFIPIPQPKLILVKGNLVSLAAKTRVAPSKTHAVRNGNENVTDEATKNASNHNLHLPFAVDHRKTGERPNNLPVDCNAAITTCTFSVLLLLLWSVTPLPAEAITSSTGVVPSALYAYGHFFSIMVITGCLAAERLLVKEGMTVEDENLIVKLDLVYGLMAALLIISGVLRANMNGDFYIHEVLFWLKMSLAGIWGGLSIFPSLTFYKRNFARKNNEAVEPISEALAARLQQIINAELTAMLTIPILATLMARGVSYWKDLPWQFGFAIAIASTVGSFFIYGKQALEWAPEEIKED